MQTLEAIHADDTKWNQLGTDLSKVYTNEADGINGSDLQYQKTFLKLMQEFDLGVSLYEMEQINVGTPNVQEVWKKLTLSSDGNTIDKTPCNN